MSSSHLTSQPSPNLPKLVYDVQETADLLRVSEVTVRRFIKKKELRTLRLGKRVLVTHEDILEFVKKKRGDQLG